MESPIGAFLAGWAPDLRSQNKQGTLQTALYEGAMSRISTPERLVAGLCERRSPGWQVLGRRQPQGVSRATGGNPSQCMERLGPARGRSSQSVTGAARLPPVAPSRRSEVVARFVSGHLHRAAAVLVVVDAVRVESDAAARDSLAGMSVDTLGPPHGAKRRYRSRSSRLDARWRTRFVAEPVPAPAGGCRRSKMAALGAARLPGGRTKPAPTIVDRRRRPRQRITPLFWWILHERPVE